MNILKISRIIAIPAIIALFMAPLSYGNTLSVISFAAASASPNYYEVNLPSIGSRLYVNTDLTGKVIVARDINTDSSIGTKYNFNFNQISDSWAEIEFENPILNFNEIILLGTKGNILVKKSLPGEDILVYKNGTSSGQLVSRLGIINDTIYFPDSEMMDIDSISIGIPKEDGEKLKGDIIVANDRAIAFQFNGANSNYNNSGTTKLVIRLRSKSLVIDLKSWGYTFDVERIGDGTMNIVSTVYGLGPETELGISYEPFEGQEIKPFSSTFKVGDINKGRPIATIKDDNKPIKFELILPE